MIRRKFSVLIFILFLFITAACNLTQMVKPTAIPVTNTPTTKFTKIPPTPTLTPTITSTPVSPSLRNYAEFKNLRFGTYFPWQGFNDPDWKAIAGREFDQANLFDGFMWRNFEPEQGKFDFSSVDAQVDFALSQNMEICAHTLFWPSYDQAYPDWVLNGKFSENQLKALTKNYITTVMNHYQEKINCWIVVEEPYNSTDRKWDLLYSTFGGYEYLDWVYQVARETDPNEVLVYNDEYNFTADDDNTGLTQTIIDRLNQKGLIDGVGICMHLDANDPPDKEKVTETMKSYGLSLHVTEIDVNLAGIPGTQEERLALQSQIYGDMLNACLDSKVCRSFSVWGFGDKYSYLSNYYSDADPTLYDNNLQPKPAYYALLNILKP